MNLRGIYAITDSALTPGNELLPAVEQALAGGISLLQYRNKSDDRQHLLSQARALQKLCADYDVPLLINDDVELCLAVGAAGVHLGQQDTDIQKAREALGQQAIIGVTCHAGLQLAEQAQQAGASYVAFGRFFPSRTKPDASAAPLEVLSRARERLSLPIAAIGGITADNAEQVLEAGADLLAVINYLFSSQDVAGRARELGSLLPPAN